MSEVTDTLPSVADEKSLRAGAREALKKATRGVGVATSGLRPPPDFLIIGAKRGGTTSFYFDLLAHPQVVRLFPPPVPGLKADATKGIHYFDSNYPRGHRWYRSYLPTSAARRLTERRNGAPAVAGEASPYYLFHPMAAERAHDEVPAAKIVVLLRDPVLRTYSHWKERRRSGAEELDFAAALAAEPDRLRGERERLAADPAYNSYAWEQQSYATQSEYAAPLAAWVDRFGRDQVLVLTSEDYYADPVTVLRRTDEFLGLPPREASTGKVRNAAAGDELDPDLRTMLEDRFREPNRALVQLIGHELPWT